MIRETEKFEPRSPREIEPPFNPEKEITKEDWKEIKKELDTERRIKHWLIFCEEAGDIKIINPEFFEQEISITDKDWESMKGKDYGLGFCREKKIWETFTIIAEGMRIFDPERFNKEVSISNEDWEGMKGVVGRLREEERWEILSRYLEAMKIIAPERFQQDRPYTDEDWQKIKERIEYWQKGNAYWEEEFAPLSAGAKIIAPEDFEREISIEEKSWQGMKGDFEKCRESKYWARYLRLAREMKILASPKVEVSPEGGLKVE